MPLTSRTRRLFVAGLVAVVGAGATYGVAIGSDHQDTAEVELNPKMDLTDVYAFPSPTTGRIVLAMNTRAFLTPGQTASTTFDPNLLYQFKVDNTGDAREDRVIQVSFTGEGADQRVEVRGPVAPPVQGAMGNRIASTDPIVTGALNTNLGTATGVQVFAGPRDDSFFIDLEAAFCILPDRKPVAGPLSTPCALTANPSAPFFFRPAASAVNYVRGFNTLSIVIELPSSMLENTAPGRLGIWGTISR